MKKPEDALPRLKECESDMMSRFNKADLTKETRGKMWSSWTTKKLVGQRELTSQKTRALWKMKAGKSQSAETIFRKEIKRDWICGLKGPIVALDKVRAEFVLELVFWPETFCGSGLPRGLRHGSRDVEKAVVGRCLALFGSVGQPEGAHSLHALERSREVWTAR